MIIFLYGPDSYRSRKKLEELENKFQKEIDPSGQSMSFLDGASLNLAELNEKAGSGSLFARKHFIVVDGIFDNKSDSILDGAADFVSRHINNAGKEDENIIIFRDGDLKEKGSKFKKGAKKLFNLLEKQKYSQEFKNLSDSQLLSFIKETAAGYGKKISPAAAKELALRLGHDLWQLTSGLKKAALSSDNGEIGIDEIKDQVKGNIDENIFALADAASIKDKKMALRLLEEQYLAGLNEDYILAMLIRQFKILLQVKASAPGMSPAQIASTLKLHPFVAKKSLSQARLFSEEDLRDSLNRLLEIDYRNKSGRGQIKAELGIFIASL